MEAAESKVGIGAVLTQKGKPIKFSSKKICTTRHKWITYEHEFYAVIWTFCHWNLMQRDFIHRIDHRSFKFFNSQKILNNLHAKWVEFFQKLHYSFKHRIRQANKVADALSRKDTLLLVLRFDLQDFIHLKDLSKEDEDFFQNYGLCA